MSAVQIITTTPSREVAEQIADKLVEDRLAGCVQIDGPIASTYRWQGSVERDQEWRLLIKSLDSRVAQIEAAICQMHPYEVPEILAVPVVHGSQRYLQWLAEQVEP